MNYSNDDDNNKRNLPELWTRYYSSLEGVAIGNLSDQQLLKFLGNGRQCGVLLETQIANMFSTMKEAEKQGKGADIFCNVLGSIQAKTFRNKVRNTSKKDIFITKSSLWDSRKRRQQLGEDVSKTTKDYISSYDTFLLIDISRMGIDFSFSFIFVPSSYIGTHHQNGFISINDINEAESSNRKQTKDRKGAVLYDSISCGSMCCSLSSFHQ